MKTVPVGFTATLCILASACRFDPTGLAGPDARPSDADARLPDAGCTDGCEPPGALRCATDHASLETCAPGPGACGTWVAGAVCAQDEQCADPTGDASAHCGPCLTCSPGDVTCPVEGGAQRAVCGYTGSGFCTGWEAEDCDPGTRCHAPSPDGPATCESCIHCTATEPLCDATGLAIERCDLDGTTGCRTPGSFACGPGMSCAPGAATDTCAREAFAGLTAPGSPAYPTQLLGNPTTGTGPVSKDYLVGDRYTTPVPLTALEIHTYGTAGGHAKVSIYDHDAVNDVPGNRLLPEVTSALASDDWTTIALPIPVLLPAGTYWIVFDLDKAQGITYSSATGGVRVWRALSYGAGLPDTGGTGFTHVTSMDCTYVTGVAVAGYAKATRVTVSEPTVEASALAFYAHDAGNVRLALYDDLGGPAFLRWEAGSTAAPAGAWTVLPVAAGVPAALTLSAGTYWLVWQWDGVTAGPSYSAGAAGDGHWIAQPYGSLPGVWMGGTASDETWSVYLTYTVHAPPLGW